MSSGTEDTPVPLRRFSVEEYHRLIDAGVFGADDRFELLEGWIVTKMVRNPPHDVPIALAQAALSPWLQAPWHLRIQSAITTAHSEPEPDLALMWGPPREY